MIRIGGNINTVGVTNASGIATFKLGPVPAGFMGQTFFTQWGLIDPAFNTLAFSEGASFLVY
ncbi:MAG: hypothetical protein GY711_12035 [bacterium]|nr:hypothetical protein [bacterium]